MVSKKKARRFVKNQKRQGDKAKGKVRLSEQIKAKNKSQESKKAARELKEAENQPIEVDEDEAALAQINSVDDLFASSLFADKPEKDAEKDDDAKSDASSEDAFVEDEDMEDAEDDGMAADEGNDLGSIDMHKGELENLKNTDPEFYKFLLENDKDLLDFGADEPEEKEEGDGTIEAEAIPEAKTQTVSIERVDALSSAAEKGSFSAFKVMLAAFHAAAQSGQEEQKTKLQVDDPAVFGAILEWMVQNGPAQFERHSQATGSQKDRLDVKEFPRYKQLHYYARGFWSDVLAVLKMLTSSEMLELILRCVGSKEALRWLWPFKKIRSILIKRVVELWSNSSSQSVRLMSFMFLRNAAGMTQRLEKNGDDALETLIKLLYRAYVTASERYTTALMFSTLSRFRFLENCIIELLRMDDKVAYRLGYACVRQLAVVLRTACVQISKTPKAEKAKEKAKAKKKRQPEKQMLHSWSFARSLSLWAHAVVLPSMRPLAFPLATVISSAMKVKMTSYEFFPYTSFMISLLNEIQSGLEIFVPVSAYLLRVLQQLLPDSRPKSGSRIAKPVEIDLCLRITQRQQSEATTMDACFRRIITLFIDHLGVLARSPSFPELAHPILTHLRSAAKNCKVDGGRKELRQLIAQVESTTATVRQKRDELAQLPAMDKFLIFSEKEIPMAQNRARSIKERADEENSRVELEKNTAVNHLPYETGADVEEPSKKSVKKKLKKQREQAEKEVAKGTDYSDMPLDEDEVKEMAFSESEDEE